MARTSKGFRVHSRASPGQNKGNTRTFEGQKKPNKDIKRQNYDRPRASRGQKRTCKGQPPRESAILPRKIYAFIVKTIQVP